jgi:hypothetical protein
LSRSIDTTGVDALDSLDRSDPAEVAGRGGQQQEQVDMVRHVRCARTGLGFSWKLPGSSMLSDSATKVSSSARFTVPPDATPWQNGRVHTYP